MKPDFSKGLVPAVVQDADTGKVLMLAYMDEQAWAKTRETGRAWFHSRTRGLWEKGGTSGNRMEVIETRLDCDADTVLLRVKPAGPACHTGAESCFFNEPD
jgi:phosphoribosyl-ATP pyrophosphohydrolase/phosphoribosyl-AMP cyclohydrolase